MYSRMSLKLCIQNLFFGKLLCASEQLHINFRPKQSRRVYDRGELSLPTVNIVEVTKQCSTIVY
jgi:hypothetical protein